MLINRYATRTLLKQEKLRAIFEPHTDRPTDRDFQEVENIESRSAAAVVGLLRLIWNLRL